MSRYDTQLVNWLEGHGKKPKTPHHKKPKRKYSDLLPNDFLTGNFEQDAGIEPDFKDDKQLGLDPNDFTLDSADLTFGNLTLDNSSLNQIKKLTGGRSNPEFPGYKYAKTKSKRLKDGQKVPQNEDVKAPNGEHWQKGNETVSRHVYDYEDSDVFSDFNGNFYLEKIGNEFHCWIDVMSSHPIDENGKPDPHSITKKRICDNKWPDKDGSRSFALSSIAAYFAKHNIYEDTTQYPHAYNDVNMGCGAVKYWNILDGSVVTGEKPHIIAHAGETIIIDTAKMKVMKTDGTDLSKYTSFGSIFPPLYGGQINHINFSPSVGDGCEVNISYVPRIK